MIGVVTLVPLSPFSPPLQINQATHDQALVLQNALQNIPNPSAECMLRNVAIRLAQQISDEVSPYRQPLFSLSLCSLSVSFFGPPLAEEVYCKYCDVEDESLFV